MQLWEAKRSTNVNNGKKNMVGDFGVVKDEIYIKIKVQDAMSQNKSIRTKCKKQKKYRDLKMGFAL